MPSWAGVPLLRPFSKMELPSIALSRFGCPEADTGLPKMAMPPVPLNSTRLPAPAAVPPIRLKETPGSLGCGGPRGAAEAVRAAQGDAVQEVSHRGHPIGAHSSEVPLDEVALGSVIELDPVSVEADDVAGSRRGAADRIIISTGNLDAVEVVALGGTRRWRGLCPIAHTADAIRGNADKVSLDYVSACRRGESARDVNPTDRVPGNNVPVSQSRRCR